VTTLSAQMFGRLRAERVGRLCLSSDDCVRLADSATLIARSVQGSLATFAQSSFSSDVVVPRIGPRCQHDWRPIKLFLSGKAAYLQRTAAEIAGMTPKCQCASGSGRS
jgi:hypothetical protein